MLRRFLANDNGKIRVTVRAGHKEVAYACLRLLSESAIHQQWDCRRLIHNQAGSEVGCSKHARGSLRYSVGQVVPVVRPNSLKELSGMSLAGWLKAPVTSIHKS